MKVSAKFQERIVEADIPYQLDIESLIAKLGELQVLACLEYSLVGKAQQELRRLMRLKRDDAYIRDKMQLWTPFPRASRSLAFKLVKESTDD